MRRLFIALALTAAPLHAAPRIAGTWQNPQHSVRVDMEPCGARLCGTIVWADAKARDDAAAGGTDHLVGVQLFRGLEADGPDQWQGAVFVPDLNRTVSGTLTLVDARTLEVTGCAVPGLLCQTQVWTRVAAGPASRAGENDRGARRPSPY